MPDRPIPPTATFQVGDLDYEHRVGDPACDQGWCSTEGYPKPCLRSPCQGLVHADFGDEDAGDGGGYYLQTRCDACDEPER